MVLRVQKTFYIHGYAIHPLVFAASTGASNRRLSASYRPH